MNDNKVDILKEAKAHNLMVAIHTDPYNQSRCQVGFVDQINDNWIRCRSISPDGHGDGYTIMSLNNIFRIDIESNYINKVDFLANNGLDAIKDIKLTLPIMKETIVYTTLKEAQQKELIIILWTGDDSDSVIGYVVDLKTDIVKILVIDDLGREDGLIWIELTKITAVECNGRKCQMLKALNKNRK